MMSLVKESVKPICRCAAHSRIHNRDTNRRDGYNAWSDDKSREKIILCASSGEMALQ